MSPGAGTAICLLPFEQRFLSASQTYLFQIACLLPQVKLGVLKTNKPLTLYDHPDSSYTTCMATGRDGNAVLSGHADGSLHVFNFDDGSTPAGMAKFAQHSCPPNAMSWGTEAVLVTGNDCKVQCLLYTAHCLPCS